MGRLLLVFFLIICHFLVVYVLSYFAVPNHF